MNTPRQIHPILRIPPPLLFVATFFIGMALQHMARWDFSVGRGIHHLGFGLVGCAVAFALWSIGTLLVARTTLIPFGEASKLVTWGPYRFTRNPMYVSLVVAYVGAAGIFSQAFSAVLLALPIGLISKIVIPFEEERMREIFGTAYAEYCARVRRWL